MATTALTALCDDPRRAVPLAGSRNFRDIGGYPTQDGRRVRWGLVYRSGSLAGVTAEGVEALRTLGVRGLCDLRTTRERTGEPHGFAETLGLSCWSREYETSFGELRTLLAAELPGGEAREAMMAGYRRLPYEQAPAYAELFRRVAAGELPLVFNCSAGKDRAGTAAALLLTALGVPRETVMADYALTDRFVDLEKAIARSGTPGSLLDRQPPEVVRAILGCDPGYMAAALDTVAASPEAFSAYLADTLGVNAEALASIQARLLEPA